jgi:hypothetical protein
MKKGLRIFVSVIGIGLIMGLTGCGAEKKEKKNTEPSETNPVIVDNDKLSETATLETIKVEYAPIIYDGKYTYFTVDITNLLNVEQDLSEVKAFVTYYDENGVERADDFLFGIAGVLAPNETRQETSKITSDLRETISVRYEVK